MMSVVVLLLSSGLGVACAGSGVLFGAVDLSPRQGAPPARAAESLESTAPLPPPDFLPSCLELIRRGRNAEARALLQPVVAGHPGWSRAHFYLGLTYHAEHRYEEASELFRRALALDPESSAPRMYQGWSLYYLGRLDQARGMFESYLAAHPAYADAIFALGLIDFDGDALDSARSRFEETIRLAREKRDTSTEAKARARLADVWIRGGDWERARADLERSIRLNPDNHETYFKLSRVLERLGDADGAAQVRRKHDEIRRRARPESAKVEETLQP